MMRHNGIIEQSLIRTGNDPMILRERNRCLCTRSTNLWNIRDDSFGYSAYLIIPRKILNAEAIWGYQQIAGYQLTRKYVQTLVPIYMISVVPHASHLLE